MITKQKGSKPGTIAVTFTFPGSIWAEQVCLVGDFNNWDYHSLPMRRSNRHGSDWMLTLELEQGRSYEFLYLVNDTEFCNECQADGYVEGPLAGFNSVVHT